MAGFYDRKHEAERKRKMTLDAIVQVARSRGQFNVSLRYRDDWLRKRCRQLVKDGYLVGGRRVVNGQYELYPAIDAPKALPSHNSKVVPQTASA